MTVSVPEWGGSVIVGTMTGEDRDTFDFIQAEARKKLSVTPGRGLRAFVISACAKDEKGARIFNPQQVAALGKKSASALDRVFNEAAKLNCLYEEEVDEIAKNS